MTTYISPKLFDDVAGPDGQLLVMIRPNGDFEILVPDGAEMREDPQPPEAEVPESPEPGVPRFVDPQLFYDVAGPDGQLLEVIRPNEDFEILVPEGAEVRQGPIPKEAQVRSASVYETCIGGWMHVCIDGICRKKVPEQAC